MAPNSQLVLFNDLLVIMNNMIVLKGITSTQSRILQKYFDISFDNFILLALVSNIIPIY